MPPGPSRSPRSGAHGGEVLLGQHLGRDHQRALVPALHGGEQCGQRDDGLARADVALEEAVHGEGPGHVGDDDGERAALRRRELVGQAGEEARDEGVGDAAGDLAGRDVVVQGAGVDLEGAAAQDERQLEAEQLVEDEAAVGRRPWPRRTRAVDGVEGLGAAPRDRARCATPRAAGRRTRRPASSASSTNAPISQLVRPTLAEAGYTGRMRSVRRSGAWRRRSRRRPGWPSGGGPGTRLTLPKKMASVPASSCLARQGWLKKTIVEAAGVVAHGELDHGTTRAGCVGTRADCTSASTAASSPTSRSDTSAWRVRSM